MTTTTATRTVQEIITDIYALPDTNNITIPDSYGMPQRASYYHIRVMNDTVRPMTGVGSPRDAIERQFDYREVNARRARYPRTYYIGRIRVPHTSSVDDFDCTCGCMELLEELRVACEAVGLDSDYDGITMWNDR